jgi:hypothetical protein
MNTEGIHYTTLVVFGSEQRSTVTSPDVFGRLASTLHSYLGYVEVSIRCSGQIDNASGKNIAPRAGTFDKKRLEQWEQSLADGTFMQFELYDAASRRDSYTDPTAYAAINKMWSFSPSGYSERTPTGAENNITLALPNDKISIEDLKVLLKTFAETIDAVYGFIEPDVTWDVSVGDGLRARMIDLRWEEVGSNDYKRVLYNMNDMVPRLYRVNLFSRSQFRDHNPLLLPTSLTHSVDALSHGRVLIEFIEDPQKNDAFRLEVEPFFNLVPK